MRKIKCYLPSGRFEIKTVMSFGAMLKISEQFDRWEYM